jgi:2-haloacid dehalogenase
MTRVVGFDVFGTLCDPAPLADYFIPWSDAGADIVARWRRTQVEYVLRRSAMQRYVDFAHLTAQALRATLADMHVYIPVAHHHQLCQQWLSLPLHPQTTEVLELLSSAGWHCWLCSNATPHMLQAIATCHNLTPYLSGLWSADSIRTYKPHPEVYHQFARTTGVARSACWLISNNSWDALGAVHAGIHAIHIKPHATPSDFWDITADVTVPDLRTAAHYLIANTHAL